MTFIDKLTAIAAENARQDNSKICGLYDAEELYLEISKKGRKVWRFKFQIEDRDKNSKRMQQPSLKGRLQIFPHHLVRLASLLEISFLPIF